MAKIEDWHREAATPEIIPWAHRLRKECLGRKPIDLLDITAKRAVELANQFDAMQCKIEVLQAEVTRLRGLCVKSDGLFGLWRYRFKGTPMPDDLIGEIEEHIGNLRRASKGEV